MRKHLSVAGACVCLYTGKPCITGILNFPFYLILKNILYFFFRFLRILSYFACIFIQKSTELHYGYTVPSDLKLAGPVLMIGQMITINYPEWHVSNIKSSHVPEDISSKVLLTMRLLFFLDILVHFFIVVLFNVYYYLSFLVNNLINLFISCQDLALKYST